MEHDQMLIKSKVTGALYDDKKTVHVYNVLQAYRYMVAGARCLDIFPSHGKGKEERLVFVFSKEDDNMLHPLWCAHKLK